MVQSMTGFGSAERGGFRVEIRSLNHRFLEISMKLPPGLAEHEMPLREILRERFGRGKLDVYVSTTGEGRLKLKLDSAAAGEILKALQGLKEELSLPGGIGMETLLSWKALFMTEELSYDTGPLYEAFGEAVAGVQNMREREGEALAGEIEARAASLDALNGRIAELYPAVREESRERFIRRLKGFLPGEYDEAKILQEASSQAERSDISEEVSRVKNHIGHLRKILSAGGKIGRQLDFLLQELNREANTIAAKAEDYRVLSLVIEMKAETEKAREQVQNIQ
jgi:uncharacterized protein (TIGR00255 family)